MLIDPTFRVPAKEAAQYSEAELAQFKIDFAAQEKSRPGVVARGCLPCVWFLLVGSLGMGLGEWLKVPAMGAAGALSAVVGAVYLTHRLRIRPCPACQYDIEGNIGFYCPCCGRKSLNHVFNDPRCVNCGVVLKWNRWMRGHPRMFHVHACSVCGVWLSDGGVGPPG